MKQFAVIGIGRFGYSVVKTLVENGCQVLAIDANEEPIKEIEDIATQAVQLDATDEKALKAVGITNIDTAVVAIGHDMEASILITLLLKELGIKEIISKAISPLHGRVLEKIGSGRVVYPEGDMGEKLANALASPTILDHIEISQEYGIFEIATPSAFIGKTLRDLKLRSKYGLNIIAIKRKVPNKLKEEEEKINISPVAEDIIDEKDTLVIIGKKDNMGKFERKNGKE